MFITQFFYTFASDSTHFRRQSALYIYKLVLADFPNVWTSAGGRYSQFPRDYVITYFLDVVLPIARLRSRRITEGFVAVSTPLSLLWR